MSRDCFAELASAIKVLAMTHDSRDKEFLYAHEAVAHGLPTEQAGDELRCEEFGELSDIIDALSDEEVSGLIDSVGLDVEAVATAGHEFVQSFIRQCKISASFEAQALAWKNIVHTIRHDMVYDMTYDIVQVASAPPQAAILPVCNRGWRKFHDDQFKRDRCVAYLVKTDNLEIVEPARIRCEALEYNDTNMNVSARKLCAIEQSSAFRNTSRFARSKYMHPRKISRVKSDKESMI